MEVGFTDQAVRKVSDATPDDFKQADVWVICTPTHFNNATRHLRNSLKSAIEAGAEDKRAVAIDTRYESVSKGANDKVVPILAAAGVQVLFVESYAIVSNRLREGEELKAVTLGRKIAGALRR